MLFRFSLYGFLKNQQYYDLFLILAFREKGLSFTTIGLLVGFREIAINLMEIPTGAVADVLGRRRSMIASHVAYVLSFVCFAFASPVALSYAGMLAVLFGAMLLFSAGEAFRTGTHKAIIFDWLAREGRGGEKTRVYGFTRSWSKLGSAVSVVIAAVLVFLTGRYSDVFLFCIPPYLANIVNFLTYPKYLDGEPDDGRGVRDVARALAQTFRQTFRSGALRRLLVESMGFEGGFKVTKDYLQPLIRSAALSLPLLVGFSDLRRTAVLVGAVGFVLYVLSSFASRHADWFARKAGSEQAGARRLWGLDLVIFAAMAAGLAAGVSAAAVTAFVALSIIQNFWRPILISRVADEADATRMATVLSAESQAKTLFAAVLAPLLGLAVDLAGRWSGPASPRRFLPVAIVGTGIAAGMLLVSAVSSRRRAAFAAEPASTPGSDAADAS